MPTGPAAVHHKLLTLISEPARPTRGSRERCAAPALPPTQALPRARSRLIGAPPHLLSSCRQVLERFKADEHATVVFVRKGRFVTRTIRAALSRAVLPPKVRLNRRLRRGAKITSLKVRLLAGLIDVSAGLSVVAVAVAVAA